ncbi:MAG: DUF2625 domain-containing protein [Mucilaginibacter sp.]
MVNRLVTPALLLLIFSIMGASAQNKLRQIDELSKDTSGWDVVQEAMRIARNKYEILPADKERAKTALYQTQVTTRSPMGAVIYLTGGILIENGWIRVLGSGNPKLNRTLPEWNKGKSFKEFGEAPKFLLVADDAIGGFFAINGGEFGNEDLGKIYYLAPDDLKWEPLKLTYTDFLNICFSVNIEQFYSGLLWKSYKDDIKSLSGNESFFIYPYPWTKEGKDVNKDSRKVIPVQELYELETGFLKTSQ